MYLATHKLSFTGVKPDLSIGSASEELLDTSLALFFCGEGDRFQEKLKYSCITSSIIKYLLLTESTLERHLEDALAIKTVRITSKTF